jgi:hypothetical protein
MGEAAHVVAVHVDHGPVQPGLVNGTPRSCRRFGRRHLDGSRRLATLLDVAARFRIPPSPL